MKKAILFCSLLATAAIAEDFYKPASVHCPGRDSSCLTNMIAGIGTNYTTIMLDGGPWAISNTVIVPSNIELLFARNVSFTNVGTNAVHILTDRTRQDWFTNVNVKGSVNATGTLAVVGNATVTGRVTAAAFTGDGSGLSNVTIGGTIGYSIDGTTNITAYTITSTAIATGGIATANLADGSVTAPKMASNSVWGTSNIVQNSIIGNNLATGAVDNTQLATNAITTQKITDGTITSNDIAAATIGIDKIPTNYAGLQRMVGFVTTSGSAAGVGAGGARVMMISTTQVGKARSYHLFCYVATSNATDANFYNELAITAQVSSNGTVWLDADKGETVQGAVNGNGIAKAGKLSWDVPPGMYFQVFCNAGTTLTLHQGWTNSFQYGYPSTE